LLPSLSRNCCVFLALMVVPTTWVTFVAEKYGKTVPELASTSFLRCTAERSSVKLAKYTQTFFIVDDTASTFAVSTFAGACSCALYHPFLPLRSPDAEGPCTSCCASAISTQEKSCERLRFGSSGFFVFRVRVTRVFPACTHCT